MADNQQEATNESKKEAPASGLKGAPIIIKRIVSGGHGGHHGGAWKVAYADFVTAMMAFFLLMWLLNAVPSDKLTGIAQYFEPTVGLKGQKGIGFEGGKAQSEEGISNFDRAQGVKYGVMQKGEIVASPQTGDQVSAEELDNQRFAMVEGEINKIITNDQEMAAFKDAIDVVQTPEGLMIRIMDQEKYPMFIAGSAELQPYAKNILAKIARMIKFSPNYLSIDGHSDADTGVFNYSSYSNWELSADRANAARRFLKDQGIQDEQVNRVVAHADTSPIDKANPYSPRNRRITITLLRNTIMPFNKVSVPQELVKDPAQNTFDEEAKGIR